MRALTTLSLVLTIALALPACALNKQKGAINDASLAVAAVSVGVDMGERAATEYFEQFPAEDTEKYCQGEITLFILDQVIDGLHLVADSIKLWRTSIVVYEASKEAGGKPTMDEILSSEADWLKVTVDVIVILNYGIVYAKSAGVDIPDMLEYAWSLIYGLTGQPKLEDPDLTWDKLEGGVCEEYLP